MTDMFWVGCLDGVRNKQFFVYLSVLNQLPLPSPLPATTTKSLLYNGRIAEEVNCLLSHRDDALVSQLAHSLNQVSTEHMWVSLSKRLSSPAEEYDSFRRKALAWHVNKDLQMRFNSMCYVI